MLGRSASAVNCTFGQSCGCHDRMFDRHGRQKPGLPKELCADKRRLPSMRLGAVARFMPSNRVHHREGVSRVSRTRNCRGQFGRIRLFSTAGGDSPKVQCLVLRVHGTMQLSIPWFAAVRAYRLPASPTQAAVRNRQPGAASCRAPTSSRTGRSSPCHSTVHQTFVEPPLLGIACPVLHARQSASQG